MLTARDSLRLGSVAPNFDAQTSTGNVSFHDFIGNHWVVLFSHPDDFTPICTTELGAFAKLEPEFTARGVKLIGLVGLLTPLRGMENEGRRVRAENNKILTNAI